MITIAVGKKLINFANVIFGTVCHNSISSLKYVINRLLHGIYHIAMCIIPRFISDLELDKSIRYGSFGMIPGLILKMSRNNLSIYIRLEEHICDPITVRSCNLIA